MDLWCETVVVAPDGGMCSATTPCVNQSRASQWRTGASGCLTASVYIVHCGALTCDLHFQKKYMFMVIGELATQLFMSDDVSRARRPFTTGCVKLQLASLRRDAWRHNEGKHATLLRLVEILICCPVETSLVLHSRDVPGPDNKH